MPDIDWSAYTDAELIEAQAQITDEQVKRSALATIPTQVSDLNAQYLDAEGVEPGQEWRQPAGAHDAYPRDWIVTHTGLTWRSLVDANVWEPGIANWAVESGEEWPAWVQPTGSTDAYPAGAKVSHLDKHWTSDVDANVWQPSIYGWTEAP